MTYTAYQVRLNGSLDNRENLNNIDEVNEWLHRNHNRYANVKIIGSNGNYRDMTSNGREYEVIGGSHLN